MASSVVENYVTIPAGVTVNLDGRKVRVAGEKGELVRDFGHARVEIALDGGRLRLWAVNPKKRQAAAVNTLATHVNNMIKGVTEGFTYKLKIVFIHFPLNVRLQNGKVAVGNFLGERRPREAAIVGKTKVTIKGDDMIVEGIDIEEVGQTAANIQQLTKVKSKDLRKFLDGIYVSSKE
jgi:large subunit ribosomal protein L6